MIQPHSTVVSVKWMRKTSMNQYEVISKIYCKLKRKGTVHAGCSAWAIGKQMEAAAQTGPRCRGSSRKRVPGFTAVGAMHFLSHFAWCLLAEMLLWLAACSSWGQGSGHWFLSSLRLMPKMSNLAQMPEP